LKVFSFYTNYNFSNLFNYSLNFPLQENTDLEKFVEEKPKNLSQPLFGYFGKPQAVFSHRRL
jgi:hypothetical protein